MKPRAVLVVVLAACVLGLLWFAMQPHRGGAQPAVVAGNGSEEEGVRAEGELLGTPEDAGVEAPRASAGREAEARVVAQSAGPWAGELAGVVGRLVEADGSPVAHMRVALFEADALQFLGGDWEQLGEQPVALELGSTRTDGEGRFEFADTARASAFHGLGIDLGAGRATLRVVEAALENGKRNDLGDIVLGAFGVFTGRVVDGEGEPIAGARVRVAPLPEDVLMVDIYDWRRDTVFSMGEQLLELPERYRDVLSLLPVPTAMSGVDGRFRIEGVPLTQVIGGVDKAGWVGTAIQEIEAVGGEQDLGDLVLSRGRTVRGVVVDGQGQPVPGAEAVAGALSEIGVGLLQPCGSSDGAGRFSLGGVSEEGIVLVAARRRPSDAWVLVTDPAEGEVRIVLPTATTMTVHVHGGDGLPLGGARLEAVRVEKDQGFGALDFFEMFGGSSHATLDTREPEPGTLVCDGIAPGTYGVTARIAGYAPSTLRVEVPETGCEVTLTVGLGSSIALRVIDGETREPVARARASIVRQDREFPTSLAVAWTDEEGKASLGPFAREGTESLHRPRGGRAVLVEHPRYGNAVVPIQGNPAALLVEMRAGGELVGHIHWGGAVPDRPYMVSITIDDAVPMDGFFVTPRLALSDESGDFRIANLAAGTYGVRVFERFLGGDPLALFREDWEPTEVFSGSAKIPPGTTTELDVDLSPSGMGPTGAIAGSVRVFGRGLEGARVSIQGNVQLQLTTDSRGMFHTGEISTLGSLWVTIEGDVPLPSGEHRHATLYQALLDIEDGDVYQLDLDLEPFELLVNVVESGSGTPIEGADVTLAAEEEGTARFWQNETSKTDASGGVSLLVLKPGPHQLTVQHEAFAGSHRELEATSEMSFAPLRVELSAGVSCSGRVLAGPVEASTQGFCYIQVESEETGGIQGVGLDRSALDFDIKGLAPGHYTAQIYLDGTMGTPIEFDLGPEGAKDLEWAFTPAEQASAY